MRGFIATGIVITMLSNFAAAQTTATLAAPQSEAQTIQEMKQEIQVLQQRLQVLEDQQKSNNEKTDAKQDEGTDTALTAPTAVPASSRNIHDLSGIQWRGFGEVDYKVLNQKTPELGTNGFVPGSAGGFYTGDLDLLLTSQISERSGFLAELVIGEEDAQTFQTSLDRVLFNYDYNDHLRASFGRYHTGIGYYNQAFHSGKWLQATADRPLIMQFADEGGILPTQAVGMSFTGAVPSKGLGLNYVVEYGSSDTIRSAIDGSGRLIDENNGNHINVGFFFLPDRFPGLQIGGSAYHDQISDFDKGPSVRLNQSIFNAHLVYNSGGWEFLNEGFLIRHDYMQLPLNFNMPAFYSQISKRLGHTRPFFRYQYINANPDSIFNDVSRREGPSFGARYDFTESIGFKLQFDHTLRTHEPALDGVESQLVFAF